MDHVDAHRAGVPLPYQVAVGYTESPQHPTVVGHRLHASVGDVLGGWGNAAGDPVVRKCLAVVWVPTTQSLISRVSSLERVEHIACTSITRRMHSAFNMYMCDSLVYLYTVCILAYSLHVQSYGAGWHTDIQVYTVTDLQSIIGDLQQLSHSEMPELRVSLQTSHALQNTHVYLPVSMAPWRVRVLLCYAELIPYTHTQRCSSNEMPAIRTQKGKVYLPGQ